MPTRILTPDPTGSAAQGISAADIINTGNITGPQQAVSISTVGLSTVGISITGTWVATLNFEGTVDGVTFIPIGTIPEPIGTVTTTATANGQFVAEVAGMNLFRVRAAPFTSGTVVVSLEGSIATFVTPTQIADGSTAQNETLVDRLKVVASVYGANPTAAAGQKLIVIAARPGAPGVADNAIVNASKGDGVQDDITGVGRVVAPAAGAAIVTIAAASLPAGTYLVWATGNTSAVTDDANAQLQAGATAIAAVYGQTGPIRITLGGATALSVNAIIAGTAGISYTFSISARRVA